MPSEVAYVNAHGPGTAQCDAAEARVLDELFPEAAGIFSVKPLIGHCQAAASAVEVLATIYAFQTGYIPAPPQVAPGTPGCVDGLTPATARSDGQVLHRDGRLQLRRRARRTRQPELERPRRAPRQRLKIDLQAADDLGLW